MMAPVPDSDTQTNILKVVAADRSPKSATAIAKALPVGGRPSTKDLKALLNRMAVAGLIVPFAGKKDAFIAEPIETWARARLLELLRAGVQTESKLKAALTRHHSTLLGPILESMVKGGTAFIHPPLTSSGKNSYALTAPDPLTYIAKDLRKLLDTARAKGFDLAAIRDAVVRHLAAMVATPVAPLAPDSRAAPASPASRSTLLDTMRRLEPRLDQGVTVPLSRLREMLAADYDRASFDAEILRLARTEVLVLHSHAWPARLSSDETDSLIDNGRGGWFDSAGLRRRS